MQHFKTEISPLFRIIFALLDPDPADKNQCWSMRIRIRIKVMSWIRICIKVISWIRIRSNLKITSQNKWNISLFEHFKFWGFFWKLGSGSRSASKWQTGSGSASKWKAGSWTGSAPKWRGSASLFLDTGTFILRNVWPDGVSLDPVPAEGAGGGGEGAVALHHFPDPRHLHKERSLLYRFCITITTAWLHTPLWRSPVPR